MAEDLHELLERIKWARDEIPAVTAELDAYVARCFRIGERANLNPNMATLVIEISEPVPVSARARTGTIANELRSCLDGLASSLAVRNGKTASGVYFPVGETEGSFDTDKRLKDKIRKLSAADRDAVLAFRPFAVGNDGQPGNLLLYGLHHADICRKHHRLVATSTTHSMSFVNGYVGILRGFGGSLDQPVNRVAEISNDSRADLRFQPTFVYAEPDVLRHRSVVETLNEFANVTETIVTAFT